MKTDWVGETQDLCLRYRGLPVVRSQIARGAARRAASGALMMDRPRPNSRRRAHACLAILSR